MPNHLHSERSAYLRQHAGDPVDWYPWGEEAFAKARREDKPVFLSIGYASCHWCHVMARESFADPEVAAVLNRGFVAVKVDREERPDVDAVYLEVCASLTGSGGWPLTVLMSPQQEPFFAATYLPRQSRGRQMGLLPLLLAVEDKWRRDRQSLLRAGTEITRQLRREREAAAPQPLETLLQSAVEELLGSLDREYGGFGAAPKFPAGHRLLFLLRFGALSGDKRARQAVDLTLRQMARGGICDQIGGGFARYSTDREWLAPHFEKTLYDNALLALCYTEAWQDGHLAFYRDTAEATLDYCLRELHLPGGGFASSQDADSEGEEGKYYLFTPAELERVLGSEDARHFAEAYDITPEGNFPGGSIPNLLLNPRWALLPEGLGDLREKLREYRERRFPLGRDDKIVTAWNGLLLSALARAGRVFHDPRYALAARELGDYLLRRAGAAEPERLLAVTYAEGGPALPAQLDDYAFTALGLLELYGLDYDSGLLLRAEALAGIILREFADPAGGFFRTGTRAERLIKRPKESFDRALPSGNAAAALLFDRLARLSGQERWREAWEGQLAFLCREAAQVPAGFTGGLIAALSAVYPTRELVCVCEEPPAVLEQITGRYAPELSLLLKRPGDRQLAAFAPFTETMDLLDGHSALYPCRDHSCALPQKL